MSENMRKINEIVAALLGYRSVDDMYDYRLTGQQEQIRDHYISVLIKHLGVPKVYNKNKRNAPSDAVYVGRGSPYGNPFVVGVDGTRDEVCDRFRDEILPTLDVSELRGKSLLCFCSPKRCHADDILIEANRTHWTPVPKNPIKE